MSSPCCSFIHSSTTADDAVSQADVLLPRWDVHTHRLGGDRNHAIWNCEQGDTSFLSMDREDARHALRPCYLSASVHPYRLTEQNMTEQWTWLQEAVKDERVVAIGEVGIDKTVSLPLELQASLFRTIASFASERGLPLIIHAVRSSNEIITIKNALRPRNGWIIHGFRGKKELAQTYLHHGCYLSFGEKYQEESLRIVPLERLFIETDESEVGIETLYRRAAAVKGVPEEELAQAVHRNISGLFFRQ